MISNMPLMKAIMAKMDWLDQNQRQIAQNVANSDTPGYRPEMLKPVDFKSMLSPVLGGAGGGTPVALEATNAKHFGIGGAADGAGAKSIKQKIVYESSPDDNGVVIEEQLYKANENSMQYQMATDLYRRNIGMIRMVLQGARG